MKRTRENASLFIFDLLKEHLPHPCEVPGYEPFSDRVVHTTMAVVLILAVLYQVI